MKPVAMIAALRPFRCRAVIGYEPGAGIRERIMKPADDSSTRARPARRGAKTGRGPWLMLAAWIGAVAVLFIVGLLIRGM